MTERNDKAAPPLEIHDLTVSYHKKPVLWGVDLEVPKGKLIGIVGPNGAGKSTLIKAAMGLLPLNSGWVKVFGQPVRRNLRRVGYVPQRESVDWDFPVRAIDVVLMGTYHRLGWLRRVGREERRLAESCLERVGMADFATRQIGRLSGGQQQRVFLARALAQQADIYFLDEPLAGVDAQSQQQIFEVLSSLRDEGKLVLIVHHDLRTAASWFDRVALVDMRLVAAGPTDEVLSRENLARTYSGHLEVLDELGRAVEAGRRTP